MYLINSTKHFVSSEPTLTTVTVSAQFANQLYCIIMKTEYANEYNDIPSKDIDLGSNFSTNHGWGVRHVQTLIMFFAMTITLIVRTHYGVTIVAMTHVARPNTTIANASCDMHLNDSHLYGVNCSEKQILVDAENFQTYDWPKSIQEITLSSFVFGYAIGNFPMSLISQRWGYKLLLQISFLINGLVSIPTPWLTYWGGWQIISLCRALQGLSQSGVYPAAQAYLASWIPRTERGRLGNYIFIGCNLGSILGFQITGLMTSSRWGWPSMFYGPGIMCLAMFTCITFFTVSTPCQHTKISMKEKIYILNNLSNNKKHPSIPWRAIFTSRYVWSALLANLGSGIPMVFCLFQVPSYMHHALGVNIKNSGLLSSLPYVAASIGLACFGYLSDFLISRKFLSLLTVRKLSNTIATVGISACLGTVTFTENVTLAVSLFIIAMFTYTGVHTGWMLSFIDLAPNYSSLLMGASNSITVSSSLLISVLISQVVYDMSKRVQWRIVFLVIAGISIVSNVFYCTVITTEEQPWNRSDTQSKATSVKKRSSIADEERIALN